MIEELWNFDPSDRIALQLYLEDGPEGCADSLASLLRQDIFHVRMKQLVWKLFQEESHEDKPSSVRIRAILEESALKEMISNVTTKFYQHSSATSMRRSQLNPRVIVSRKSCDETVDHIREARQSWENGILEELRAIVAEAKRPFLLIRERSERNPFLDTVQCAEKESTVKFLFDSEDLMETVLSIRNPAMHISGMPSLPGLMQLQVRPFSLEEVGRRFADLGNIHCQLGLDETQTSAQGLKVLLQRQEEAELVLAGASAREARRLMRRGIPPSLRCRVWRLACGLFERVTASEDQYFQRLRSECDRLDLVTDELIMHDLQTVLDDPRFFVFEEELKEVLLCFSRDTYVRHHAQYEIHAPLLREMGSEFGPDTAAPPCAVQPHLGFATYFAPLCYIFKHKPSLFFVSRHLYCNLWCKLNVFTSNDGTLLSLCQAFESLLWDSHARLFLHLVNIGIQPLKVAFPWMQLAFIGLLEIDQLLHLWERVIGFMDPMLLAVMAVAIFLHRSEMLLRCTNDADAVTILMEGSRLHVVPLLQLMVLKDSKMS